MGLCTPAVALTFNRVTMSMTGIWPRENPDTYYKFKTFMSWFLSWGVFLTMIAEAIADIHEFTKLTEILYIMITYASYLIKLSYFTYHNKTFIEMYKYLDGEVFVSYPEDMDHYMVNALRFTTYLTHLYRVVVVGLVLLYGIYPIMDNVPLPFPFPYEFGPVGRVFMYIFQMMAETVAAWDNVSLDCICVALMSIGDAQLDILIDKITRLEYDQNNEKCSFEEMDEADKKETSPYLTQCVLHHLAIIRFIEDIEKIFTVGLLAQFMASAIVICNTLFHFVLISVSSLFVMLADYFIAMVMQVFMYCWYGDNIMWKSRMVGDACYACNWHFIGKSARKSLFLMMERAKRPLRITTMSFATLSLSAFVSIIQWSYSYLTLLLRMYYKRDE